MAYGINTGYDISLVAAADLSSDQFHFVTTDGSGNAALSAAGAPAIGVLQDAPTAGEAGAVRVMGVSKVVAGAVVAVGSRVASDATGRAVVYTAASCAAAPGPVAGSQVLGIALEAAGAAGDVIAVALMHSGLSA
ncbi:MAG: DUF2190 family protein [Patescibacteria group bacterium]|nr:DUF2190 family protein [Patescibacteria group bacterium]